MVYFLLRESSSLLFCSCILIFNLTTKPDITVSGYFSSMTMSLQSTRKMVSLSGQQLELYIIQRLLCDCHFVIFIIMQSFNSPVNLPLKAIVFFPSRSFASNLYTRMDCRVQLLNTSLLTVWEGRQLQ